MKANPIPVALAAAALIFGVIGTFGLVLMGYATLSLVLFAAEGMSIVYDAGLLLMIGFLISVTGFTVSGLAYEESVNHGARR